ncbi:serine/threonine-protein kinase HAL4/sat4, partial [Teratosphaeriaceae sp. CCFEE 6253]
MQKRSTLSRLGRMFSQKDANADTRERAAVAVDTVPEASIEEGDEAASPPQRPQQPSRTPSKNGGLAGAGVMRNGSDSKREKRDE